jgi:hypothetical protein
LVKVIASDRANLPEHQADNNFLYVISPILFKTGNANESFALKKEKEEGIVSPDTCIQTFPNLQEIENKIEKDLKLSEASIGVLGGFSSTAIRRRKPIYGAIMAGSKIQACSCEGASRLAREGLGLFSNIGFGSII